MEDLLALPWPPTLSHLLLDPACSILPLSRYFCRTRVAHDRGIEVVFQLIPVDAHNGRLTFAPLSPRSISTPIPSRFLIVDRPYGVEALPARLTWPTSKNPPAAAPDTRCHAARRPQPYLTTPRSGVGK
jgi:hypothetical protein